MWAKREYGTDRNRLYYYRSGHRDRRKVVTNFARRLLFSFTPLHDVLLFVGFVIRFAHRIWATYSQSSLIGTFSVNQSLYPYGSSSSPGLSPDGARDRPPPSSAVFVWFLFRYNGAPPLANSHKVRSSPLIRLEHRTTSSSMSTLQSRSPFGHNSSSST